MPSTDTTVRFRADISQLKAEMQKAQRQVKIVNSEFKAATAGMDDWTKSEEGLTAKLKQLNSVLDLQKRKLILMEEEMIKTSVAYGEGSAQADRAKIAYNNLAASIAKTEKEIGDYEKELQELPNTLEETTDAAEEAAQGFTVMKGALANLVADGIRAAVSGLKDFAKEAIQVGMDFESGMSKVGAVSGANAEELQQLTDKAQEMGEKTKFSASESAEAFNYMAMAGWKTEDMLNGIEGIMNLAAASGSDLATASDIVTDALTAMGYGAQDAGRLADVMAAASANANTNVEMMGKTFQYAAPIVGALGYNMEDTAVAIGLMANAGIKADKAGTALRSILTRLSAPPKECANEMERFGISLTDSEGNMKSLTQVMTELRSVFKNLSQTEQTSVAKHIAGAEAMSGLLAVVNATETDFQKLTTAVNESNGAAEQMANTMNDNVGGKLTLLKSKIEGIMIKLFKRASDSMKDGIDTVDEALDKVDWNKAGDAVGTFANKAAQFFKYIIDNSSIIIHTLKTIGALFATVFVANKINTTVVAISKFINIIKSASSASTAFSGVMTAIGISMSALPVMAVVAGVAALAAGFTALNKKMDESAQATYGLTNKQKSLMESIEENADAIKAANDARMDEAEGIDTNIQKLIGMKNNYNDLIDENGNVKEGCEELADTLLNNLAEGLGITVEKLKENIDLNGKLGGSIDELIAKKKSEAKLAAFEDDYNQALKDEVENWKTLKAAKEEQKAAQDKLTEAQEKYNQARADIENSIGTPTFFESYKAVQAKKDLDAAQESYDALTQSVKEASTTWSNSQNLIENYETAMAGAVEGNAQKTNDALLSVQYGLQNYTTTSKEELEKQVINTKQGLEEIRQAYEEDAASEALVDDYKRINELAGAELDKWVAKNEQAGGDGVNKFKGSASEALDSAYDVVRQLGSGSADMLDNSLGDWGTIAENHTGDYLHILDGKKSEANTKGEGIAKETVDGINKKESEFKKAAETEAGTYNKTIQGLSDNYNASGRFMVDKLAEGSNNNVQVMETSSNKVSGTFLEAIDKKHDEAVSTGEKLGGGVVEGTDSAASQAEESGNKFGEGYFNGIGNWIKKIFDRGAELAKSAISGLQKGQQEGSPSKITTKSGEYFAEGFRNGIKAGTKAATKAAAQVGIDSVKALRAAQKEGSPSKLTYESGRNFTQGFINGIASLETSLINKTKGMVDVVLKELLRLENFDFSSVTENASNAFSKSMSKQMEYISGWVQYNNQQMLADFDNTISQLESAQANAADQAAKISEQKIKQIENQSKAKQNEILAKMAVIEATAEKKRTKKQKDALKDYEKQLKKEQEALKKAIAAEKASLTTQTQNLENTYAQAIEEQQKMKEAYQQSSSSMMSEFTSAMNEYANAAQKLIDKTMSKITDDYQEQYDALLGKQNNLIDKLKSAGDLFSVSGANVMRMNDIQAQTEAIKQYADKLSKIKKKVSGDLFDQIASYDMKEGEAFIDRLLAMTDQELQAYSDAYDEKLKVSESLGKSVYKSDFDKVASNYSKAIQEAFKSLPKELEALGWDSLKGFLSGLTTNTDYMESSIRTFISGMIDTFKQQLGIASPSKVMMKLGEYTGEGFADGILKMVNVVKDAAKEITDTVSTSLDFTDTLSSAKGSIYAAQNTSNGSRGSFSGTNTQIINFNQTNNSPKAIDRLTLYRETNNLLFNAKVGLSNV